MLADSIKSPSWYPSTSVYFLARLYSDLLWARCVLISARNLLMSVTAPNGDCHTDVSSRSCWRTAHLRTRSNVCPFTVPPPSDARTLRLNPSRFALRSSAASLFSGSDAFGSRKRNCAALVYTFRAWLPLLLSSFTYLQTNNDRVQIQYRLPVLPQNVQTHIALQVNIGMVDLLRALDFRRVVRKVLIDLEIEIKATSFVHALVRIDSELEVEDIVGVREVGLHRCTEGQLFQICERSQRLRRECEGSA